MDFSFFTARSSVAFRSPEPSLSSYLRYIAAAVWGQSKLCCASALHRLLHHYTAFSVKHNYGIAMCGCWTRMRKKRIQAEWPNVSYLCRGHYYQAASIFFCCLRFFFFCRSIDRLVKDASNGKGWRWNYYIVAWLVWRQEVDNTTYYHDDKRGGGGYYNLHDKIKIMIYR